MNLLMDLGNSRCKYAMVDNENINNIESITYSNDDKITAIKQLLSKANNLKKIIICSVLDDQLNDQNQSHSIDEIEQKSQKQDLNFRLEKDQDEIEIVDQIDQNDDETENPINEKMEIK